MRYDDDLYKRSDLRGQNFRSSDLSRGYFYNADFADSDTTGVNLSRTTLSGATFTGANMRRAYIRGADMTGATYDSTTIWPAGIGPLDGGEK